MFHLARLLGFGWLALVVCGVFGFKVANSQSQTPPATPFDRAEMLAHLAYHVMLPTYLDFETAAGSQSGPGFDDFLAAQGSDLGPRITEQFHAALTAVRAIPDPLRVAIVEQPQTVQAAYQAVHQLLILLKVDLTNVLSVTVDFSDNDGD